MQEIMRILRLSLLLALIIFIGGCTYKPVNTLFSTPTMFQKQPEPHTPVIKGQFSGLLGNSIVTIHISTLSGQEIQWGTRQGNGSWESVIPNEPEMDYIVTVKADGYVSNPLNYTIHIKGNTAYLIENGIVTNKEALHLDYIFKQEATPIPSQ